MIDLLIDYLGYTGSDPVITYLVVGFALMLGSCFIYRIVDMLCSLINMIGSYHK